MYIKKKNESIFKAKSSKSFPKNFEQLMLHPPFSFSQSSFVSFHNGHIVPEQLGPAGSRPKNLQALCDYVQQ